MLNINVYGSSSKGNCYLLSNGTTRKVKTYGRIKTSGGYIWRYSND